MGQLNFHGSKSPRSYSCSWPGPTPSARGDHKSPVSLLPRDPSSTHVRTNTPHTGVRSGRADFCHVHLRCCTHVQQLTLWFLNVSGTFVFDLLCFRTVRILSPRACFLTCCFPSGQPQLGVGTGFAPGSSAPSAAAGPVTRGRVLKASMHFSYYSFFFQGVFLHLFVNFQRQTERQTSGSHLGPSQDKAGLQNLRLPRE